MNTQNTLTWDLSDLYQSIDDPQIEVDFKTAEELIQHLTSYRGKVVNLSSPELLKLLKEGDQVSLLFDKSNLFASLLEATHVGVTEYTRFSKKIEERIITMYEPLIFIDVELSKLSEEKWQEHLTSPELEPYRKTIQKHYESSKHILSEPEERILMQKSQTSDGILNHLYSITTDTLEFEWDDKTITLEEILSKFHESDPAIRKQAAAVLSAGLAKNNKTTPAIINGLVQDKTINDKLRHYEFPEQRRFMGDDVDKETVEALIKAVNESHQLVERYYTLKKRVMGVDELYWWDRYAPLPETDAAIPLDEAKQMVHQAFEQFSPEVSSIVQKMNDIKHIDWMPSKTKRGGAFCAYGGNNYPYVLMNYTDKPRDVMTLAHELGHAVHDVYAQESNVYSQSHASLALAEVASTFGESLLFDKLLASDTLTDKDKLSIIMSNIEDRFATVFRQISMFQFEQQLHTKRREVGELSQEEIDTLWDETMKKSFASSLTYTPEHKNTWMYVGHIFHWPFYVYSYAFAQLCTLALIQQYKEKGSAFVPDYIEILKAGGSLSPKENLARFGLDLSSPDFWHKGLKVIENSIDQLEKLV